MSHYIDRKNYKATPEVVAERKAQANEAGKLPRGAMVAGFPKCDKCDLAMIDFNHIHYCDYHAKERAAS